MAVLRDETRVSGVARPHVDVQESFVPILRARVALSPAGRFARLRDDLRHCTSYRRTF
jgi:hypothetical protein